VEVEALRPAEVAVAGQAVVAAEQAAAVAEM
jgi:hypothetical protein